MLDNICAFLTGIHYCVPINEQRRRGLQINFNCHLNFHSMREVGLQANTDQWLQTDWRYVFTSHYRKLHFDRSIDLSCIEATEPRAIHSWLIHFTLVCPLLFARHYSELKQQTSSSQLIFTRTVILLAVCDECQHKRVYVHFKQHLMKHRFDLSTNHTNFFCRAKGDSMLKHFNQIE